MAIVAQVNSILEQAANKSAKKSADKLTPVLRYEAAKAGWPGDIIVNLNVRAKDGSLYIEYPEDMDTRINDLEYGDGKDAAPNAVIRPFMARYSSHLEEIVSGTLVDIMGEMGVFN